MTWPCPRCGRQIGNNIAVCPWCNEYVRGRTLFPANKAAADAAYAPERAAAMARVTRNRRRAVVLGLVALVIAVLVGVYLLVLRSTPSETPPADQGAADTGNF